MCGLGELVHLGPCVLHLLVEGEEWRCILVELLCLFRGLHGTVLIVLPPCGDGGEDTCTGDCEVGALCGTFLGFRHADGAQVEFHRATAEAAEREAHEFAERVGRVGEAVGVCVVRDGDVAQRVEVIHFHPGEFFLEEFADVRQRGGAACDEYAHRLRAAVFAAIESDAARDFLVQPRHLVARDFGNACDLRVVRLGIRAAEAHESILHLARIRFRK